MSLEQTSICVVDGSGKTLWEGKCASTPQVLAAVIRAKAPAVAILDIRMPRKTGLEVAAAVLSQAVATRVVLLTAEITDADALEAIRLGVHGVILKGMGVALLLKCIDKVHAGGLWIERESMQRAFHHVLKRDTAPAPARWFSR